jgi:hypothetical protein
MVELNTSSSVFTMAVSGGATKTLSFYANPRQKGVTLDAGGASPRPEVTQIFINPANEAQHIDLKFRWLETALVTILRC